MNEYIKKAFIKTVSFALSAAFLAQCAVLAAVSPEYTARTHEVTKHTYTIADGVHIRRPFSKTIPTVISVHIR